MCVCPSAWRSRLACASRAKWKFWKACLPVTRWSPQATNACKKTAPLCAWLTCRSLEVDDQQERVALAALVRQVVPAAPAAPVLEQALVLPQPLQQQRQRVAPVRASLWPCLAPTLA